MTDNLDTVIARNGGTLDDLLMASNMAKIYKLAERLTASAYDPTSWWNLTPPMNPTFAPGTKLRQPN